MSAPSAEFDLQTIKHFLHNHEERIIIYSIFALLFLLSLAVRVSMVKFQSGDYSAFSSWYDFVKAHGLHSFKYSFSNYNPPYTYFLYLVSLLPLPKILAIKALLIFFDFVMAYAIYLVVKVFRPEGYTALIAATASLFAPTVLLNGPLWGQFDEFYTAFILFSLWAGLKDKSRWCWILYGVAIAIKLQAIFFAPVLLVMIFRRIHWYDIVWSVVTFCILTFPPVLVGRSVSSILSIYSQQTSLFAGQLSLNAPSLWQWFPNQDFKYFNGPAVYLTGAIILIYVLYTYLYKKFSNKDLLIVTSLMLYLVPFLLPQMHDRYFFPAGIGSFVMAFAYPEWAWLAVLMQVVTIFVYTPFLFGTYIVPMSILSIVIVGIVYILSKQLLSPSATTPIKKLASTGRKRA